jgi:glycosyltransferase involved in cell wall biosynthesis
MDITPLVITYNEALNIARTLDRLGWAKRIVILDSGSTDATLDIAARRPQVEILRRPFDSFAEQCNFGLNQVTSEWVLSLDADYELSAELEAELRALTPTPEVQGYRARFVYRIGGRPLRGSLYPPRVVLYRTGAGRYDNEGHGHRLRIDGRIEPLRNVIFHDDRKPLSRWLDAQRRYARLEADHLLTAPPGQLVASDRVRLTGWLAPLVVLPYVLVAKGCLLDGRAGWFYALQRLLAEVVLALELLDRRLGQASGGETPADSGSA